jgi:MerR family redox-sensitive transcriptional activator SoxR
MSDELLSIGDVARRAGIAHSALRFYEAHGLLEAERTDGHQRRYERGVLRRIAFIRTAQQVGLKLDEIRNALATLPDHPAPAKEDWERLASTWSARLDEQIGLLVNLRDRLGSCIGCGCLSLEACAFYNPDDAARRFGPGPRYFLGDKPELAELDFA